MTADVSALSPILVARKLRFSPEFAALSQKTQRSLKRMTSATVLPPGIVEILDREQMPRRVCRWVAWGKKIQDRVVRLALVLLLRHEPSLEQPGRRSIEGWVYPIDAVLGVAERNFWKTSQCQELVKLGLLSKSKLPNNMGLFTQTWTLHWPVVFRVVKTITVSTFLREAERIASTRKKRIMTKRFKPTEADLLAIGALNTLKQLVLRGKIQLDAAALQITNKK